MILVAVPKYTRYPTPMVVILPDGTAGRSDRHWLQKRLQEVCNCTPAAAAAAAEEPGPRAGYQSSRPAAPQVP